MIKEFIAKKLFNLRSAKNISARKLSIELGQCDSYINHIENQRLIPSLDGIENICDYFGITVSDFFDANMSYPIEYKELFLELNKLTKAELDQVTNLVKMLNDGKKNQ